MKYPVKNFLRCVINNFVLRRPLPLLLSFEITQRCNAKCSFCGYWKLEEFTSELSLDEIKRLLDSAYDLGCAIFVVTGGESLLRKDLPSVLKYAKETGFSTLLLTNGYLLPQRIHEFYENLDAVSVSIDFPDVRHDKNRGLDGLLEKAIVGIKQARDYGIIANMNCVVTGQHSLDDVKELLFLARQLDCGFSVAPLFIRPAEFTNGAILGTLSEKEEDLMKLNDWNLMKSVIDMLLFYRKNGFRKTIQNTNSYLRLVKDRADFTCYPLNLQLAVASNGTVATVCAAGLYGSHNLGNVLKQDLRDIWYSEKAEMLRRKFKECTLARSMGCYLLCVAELSLPFHKPAALLDYVKKVT